MTQELPTIYLDHAATTPLDPDVAAAMQPYLTGSRFGNASSIHRYGREARTAVDEARDAVAALIRADYSELYFTGGGTESDNLALIGGMLAAPTDRNHLVTSAIEHHAVLHSAHFLRTLGYEVTTVPVDADGLVSPDAVAGDQPVLAQLYPPVMFPFASSVAKHALSTIPSIRASRCPNAGIFAC